MAVKEGFARLRTVLKVVGTLWFLIAGLVGVAAINGSRSIESVDIWIWALAFGLPPAIIWALFWIIEGFFLNRGSQ